jgi:VCBS repeat-containing protein
VVWSQGVLANDTDVDVEDLDVARVNGVAGNVGSDITLGSGATLTVTREGGGSYNPNGQFEGLDDGESATDSFTYTATDGTVESNPAMVTITVTGVNDAPVANPDAATTDEDTALTVTGVLANDTDVDIEPLRVTQVRFEGNPDVTVDPERAAAVTGTYGTLQIRADGAHTYTPNATTAQALDTDDAPVTDVFTYTVSDGTASSEAALTITLAGADDRPTLDLDGSKAGTGFTKTYKADGPRVPIADTDSVITDVDDILMESARMTLTNAKRGDQLTISGSLPKGIAATIRTVNDDMILTLAGSASADDYETAIERVRFSNSREHPDLTARVIEVVVTDGQTDSDIAITVIGVQPDHWD